MTPIKFLCSFVFCIITLSLSASAQTVYYTPSGAKYHRANCRMVKNVSSKTPLADAAKKGLTPCKICNPASSGQTLGVKSAQGTSITVQCRGITKARTRCKHKTSIGNGYCFQHQPG